MVRHQCCLGVEADCKIPCVDSLTRKVEAKYLTECHHSNIVCSNQYTWFSHQKYCFCKKHEELQKIKNGLGGKSK